MIYQKLPNANATVLSVGTTAGTLKSFIETAAGESFDLSALDGIDFNVESGSLRVAFDGLAPSTTKGLLVSGQASFRKVNLSRVSMVSTSGTISVSIQVGKSLPSESGSGAIDLSGGGGGGTPGGSDTQLQYNNSGSFGGITGFTTDGDDITVGFGNSIFADDTGGNPIGALFMENVGGTDLLSYANGHFAYSVGGDTLFARDPDGTTQQTLAMVRAVNTASTLGSFSHIGLNASSAFINYAEFIGSIVTATAGNEDGSWQINAMGGGATASTLDGSKTGINVPIAGTAGTPSLRVNSTNTGFYASASNGIAASANGSQIWRLTSSGGMLMNNRFQLAKSGNVASATSIGLSSAGNLFPITGSTTISRISSTNWTEGSEVTLKLPSGITIEHLSASGSGAQINLAGAANLTTSAVTYIKFIYDDSEWRELFRRVMP